MQIITIGSVRLPPIGGASYSGVKGYTTRNVTIPAGSSDKYVGLIGAGDLGGYRVPPTIYITSIAPSEGATQRYTSPDYRNPVTLTISRGSRYYLYTLSEAVPFSISVNLLYGSELSSLTSVSEIIPAGVTSFNGSLALEAWGETFTSYVLAVDWESSDTTILWTPQGITHV